jgi:hypothetical protein
MDEPSDRNDIATSPKADIRIHEKERPASVGNAGRTVKAGRRQIESLFAHAVACRPVYARSLFEFSPFPVQEAGIAVK